ncbi:MAG: DUF4339 domain-containing protein [Deltaproteobacteria bacterium]|nr:DUF4339 domain-containing protein [Deltaproteobacteria bacterium]
MTDWTKAGMAMMMLFLMLGCGPTVRQWNMVEGQQNLNKMEQESGTVQSADPERNMQDAIVVNVVVPRNMGCIVLAPSNEDKSAGHKTGSCPMKPIAGQDPKSELRAAWNAETGPKSNVKMAFAAMDIGPVIQSELTRALQKYYRSVTVNIVDATYTGDAIAVNTLTVYPIFGGKETVAALETQHFSGSGKSKMKIPGKHAAWFFPTMILSIPLFMWAPAMGIGIVHDVTGAKTVVAAIRQASAQLAEEIAQSGVVPEPGTVVNPALVPALTSPVPAPMPAAVAAAPAPVQPEPVAQPAQAPAASVAATPVVATSSAPAAVTSPPASSVAAAPQPASVPAPIAPSAEAEAKIWSVAVNGNTLGPFTASEVIEFIHSGSVGAETYVWTAGMSGWQPCQSVEPFASEIAKSR